MRADYVHRRNNSANLIYQRPVPPDLSKHPESQWFGKQWAARVSLGTPDVRQANVLARRLSVEWDERFQTERDRLSPATLDVLPADLVPVLVARVRSSVLSGDDATRYDGTKLRAFLEAFEYIAPPLRFLTAGQTPIYLRVEEGAPEMGGMSLAQSSRLAQIHELVATWFAGRMAAGDLSVARPVVEAEVRSVGFVVDWSRRENVAALIAVLRGLVSAWQDRVKRDRGEVIETPAAPVLAVAKTPKVEVKRISDALHVWEQEQSRPEKTVNVYRRHAAMFADLMGDPPLSTLTLPRGMEFRDKVQAWAVSQGKTATTANNALTSVKTLLHVAQQRGWVADRLLSGAVVKRGGAVEREREPWTAEDLQRLFASDLYTSYKLPTAKAAGADAAYWVPLILAFSGARLNEVAQLWTDDVFESPDGLAMEFRPNVDRDQRLKANSSRRVAPIHSQLEALGFGDYWRAIAEQGEGPLFPALPPEISHVTIWSPINPARKLDDEEAIHRGADHWLPA
ncbi:hypothetical protein JI739_17145 [Ramlibacter sp. AW1]|uniref:Core-binding (CB) domain-containing protein n=1 Tax=Ramlibacter aurantiacus TaxID=2801330 RepID=A0A936ZR47_9BURK|nr:DUF6538 domain-containing protein [Ramlibacter aurantiacus]MBL0422080.1 hypothetical protein [Ramlibacter aurantiacus]